MSCTASRPLRVDPCREFQMLDLVSRAGASEAVIFYAARILEGLAADALDRRSLPVSASVYSNLELLNRFADVTTSLRHWSHSLRQLGNAVRHLHRGVSDFDAVVATHFAECWVDWFNEQILNSSDRTRSARRLRDPGRASRNREIAGSNPASRREGRIAGADSGGAVVLEKPRLRCRLCRRPDRKGRAAPGSGRRSPATCRVGIP